MGIIRGLEGWHLIVIIAVIVLLFGAPKLPGLAKSIGQSIRSFRGEMKQMKDESKAEKDAPAGQPSSSKTGNSAGKASAKSTTTKSAKVASVAAQESSSRKPAAKKTAS